MTLPEVKEFIAPDNSAILNAIRKNASVDYQRRIPDVTKANIQEVVRNLMKWTPLKNEFIDSLVNRIGAEIFRNNTFANPWAKFKRGKLEWGDTIEEIMVGLIEARVYDPDRNYLERDLFGKYTNDVQVNFHTIDRQNFYPVSINDALLKRAFLDDQGLSSLIAQLMEAPNKSDQWDEFLAMAGLFSEYERAGGFFHVNVPDLAVVDADSADAKYALRRFREFAGNLQFISTHYNAAGMPVSATSDDLELFITPEALAAIDVEALAAAFQIDKAEIPFRINIIPKEHLNIGGAQAILTTRDFFVVADTLIETRSQPNAIGLHTNWFLHHHEIVSVSRFVPAVLFWTGPSDEIPTEETPVVGIDTVTVYDADGNTVAGGLTRGNYYQIRAAALTDPTGGPNDAVRFEIVGGPESTFTYVRQTGILSIGIDEDATSISVNIIATDTDVPQTLATLTRAIVGDKAEIWPNPGVTEDDDNDGLLEVTPDVLTKDATTDEVVIPSVVGVQYLKEGVNVNNGSVHVITVETDFTAVARTGYELAAGAPAAWTFNP